MAIGCLCPHHLYGHTKTLKMWCLNYYFFKVFFLFTIYYCSFCTSSKIVNAFFATIQRQDELFLFYFWDYYYYWLLYAIFHDFHYLEELVEIGSIIYTWTHKDGEVLFFLYFSWVGEDGADACSYIFKIGKVLAKVQRF